MIDDFIDIIVTMIKKPFTFFEVNEEAIFADSAQLLESEFGVRLEAFDASDVIFSPGEFVLMMMMDAVVVITT